MIIRKAFKEELDELKDRLVEMCRLTEDMIDNAITALVNMDRQLGHSIKDTDKRVDEYEMEIEKKCMRILLRQQPVAKDFREVSTALKMITDIERFGDQASDIGDLVYTMPQDSGKVAISDNILAMGQLAKVMVRDSVNSFIRNDEAQADRVIATDDRMDALFVSAKDELVEMIRANPQAGDEAITLMMVAKYLERIGDHAVNVAEWTKYNETGVHLKF